MDETDFRAKVAELAAIAVMFRAWEESRRDDHKEYREDIQAFRVEFRRMHEENGAITTAVNRIAIDMEGLVQRVRGNSYDLDEHGVRLTTLEKKVERLEHIRALERGAWGVIVLVGAAFGAVAGATIAVIMPGWIPHWMKGTGQ